MNSGPAKSAKKSTADQAGSTTSNRTKAIFTPEKWSQLGGRLKTLQQKADRLAGQQLEQKNRLNRITDELARLDDYLKLAPQVTDGLKQLGEQLFLQELRLVQEKLTIALQDVLEQPVTFKATPDFKNGAAVVDFSIERDGYAEDIQRGQGGSVQNILSVGLRMFALATLGKANHRGFLVLDEQDCWLRPELVPRLVRIVRDAGHELGFQVLMISHHDLSHFERYADQVFRLEPDGNSVKVLPLDLRSRPDTSFDLPP